MKKQKMIAFGTSLTQLEMKRIKGAEGTAQGSLEGGAGGQGGNAFCWIRTYGEDGSETEHYGLIFADSSAANQHCVNLIVKKGSGVYRCTYNCGL